VGVGRANGSLVRPEAGATIPARRFFNCFLALTKMLADFPLF
jgi:hypothetical protein